MATARPKRAKHRLRLTAADLAWIEETTDRIMASTANRKVEDGWRDALGRWNYCTTCHTPGAGSKSCRGVGVSVARHLINGLDR